MLAIRRFALPALLAFLAVGFLAAPHGRACETCVNPIESFQPWPPNGPFGVDITLATGRSLGAETTTPHGTLRDIKHKKKCAGRPLQLLNLGDDYDWCEGSNCFTPLAAICDTTSKSRDGVHFRECRPASGGNIEFRLRLTGENRTGATAYGYLAMTNATLYTWTIQQVLIGPPDTLDCHETISWFSIPAVDGTEYFVQVSATTTYETTFPPTAGAFTDGETENYYIYVEGSGSAAVLRLRALGSGDLVDSCDPVP